MRRYRRLTVLVAALALSVPGLAPQSQAQPLATPKAPPHERLLPLQGGRNFRDLGGYRTRDGRHVKWGLLFRAGSMHGLTPTDYTYLEGRGIRVVCDFRDTRERSNEPAVWPTDHAPVVLSDDYHLDVAGMMPKGPMSGWTEISARASLAATYPHMLVQFNSQYRRMFAELLAGHAPLAFNCTAGKDRTGIAAALLLTALGVPRATVIADYTATNRYLDQRQLVKAPPANLTPAAGGSSANADPAAGFMHMPPGVVQAFMVADPSYIEAALAVLDQHAGGADGYLRDELGLGHADLVKLRSMYLE